ncbi:MAG: hypothetical protein WCF36_08190 [Candidatus Nanopelagicales bacterium]
MTSWLDRHESDKNIPRSAVDKGRLRGSNESRGQPTCPTSNVEEIVERGFLMGYVRVQPPKDYADLSPAQRMAFWREAVLDAVERPVAAAPAERPAEVARAASRPDHSRTRAIA